MERENLSKLQDVIYEYTDIVENSKKYITNACVIAKAEDVEEVKYILNYCLKNKIKLNTNKFTEDGSYKLTPAINYRAFRESSMWCEGIAQDAGIKEKIIEPSYLEYLKNNRKEDPATFLECIKYLTPCLDYSHSIENFNNFVKAFNALWDRLLDKKNKRQSGLYLYSIIGGTGKTTFCNFLTEWANRKGVKLSTTRVPTDKFIGSEYSKNAICIITEVPKSALSNWEVMNNLIDGQTYRVEYKGRDPYEAEARSLIVCCSNFLPMEMNARRLRDSYIHFGSTPLNLSNEKHKELTRMNENSEFDYDFYVDLIEKALLSVPKASYTYDKYSNLTPFNPTAYHKAMDSDTQRGYLTVIAKYFDCNPQDNGVRISSLTLSNRINKWLDNTVTLCFDDIPLEHISVRGIYSVFRNLHNAGLIKCVKPSESVQGKMYDLSNIVKDRNLILNSSDTEIEEDRDDEVLIEKEIIDSIVTTIRSENPTTPDDDNDKTDHFDFTITEDSEVKADFNRITYQDKFSTTPHMNEEKDPYMLNGTFKEEYIKKCVENKETISRKAENIIPQYFVFECDTKSLEEQVDFINSWNESLKKEVKTITFSGNKSYHVLFPIKVSEDITASEYKTLWTQFMKRNSLIEYADTQCGSLSRLTRNPGGIREDGTVQKCLYFNKDCEVIDLDLDLITLRQTQKEIEEFNKKNRQSSPCFSSTDKTPEEILSSIKKDCDAKRGWEMIESCNYPSGTDFLSPASGMYSVLTGSGMEENEAINWIRSNYLERVAEIHPSNISMDKAKNWTPRR